MADQWVTLVVRVTPEQHKKLQEISRAKGVSMASLIRKLVDRGAS